MIAPSPRGVALVCLGLPIALAPAALDGRAWPVWVVFIAVCGGLAAVDAWRAARPRDLQLAFEAPAMLFIGEAGEATLTCTTTRGRPIVETLLDVEPPLAAAPPALGRLAPGAETRLRFPVTATRRGNGIVRACWARWAGPLGLVGHRVRVPLDRPVAVVPDVRGARAVALRFVGARDAPTGLKLERYVGDGSEFDALREYRAGFDHRAMDWKASARHRTLLVRDFRAERNHPVVLAMDTGRLMAEPLEGVPRLDLATRGALTLAYAGLKTGDRVGLFGFDAQVHCYVPPSAGTRAFPLLQARTAAFPYTTHETNFTLGLTDLLGRLRRRSLVVVFTEFVDTVTAGLMVDSLARASRRHVVLFLALRDPGLDAQAGTVPADLDALHQAVVAGDLIRERERVLVRLRRLGVHCVDAAPAEAGPALLNRYLDIRRRELV